FSFSLLFPSSFSSLFPYTTLFRSATTTVAGRHFAVGYLWRSGLAVALTQDGAQIAGFERHLLACYRTAVDPAQQESGHRFGGRGDRKSTRLNSSHVSISYAVFCLK